MSLDSNRILLDIRIDYSNDKTEKCEKRNWEPIKKKACDLIERTLPIETKHQLHISIKAKILSIQEGSLTLSVLVVFVSSAYVAISQFHDFVKGAKEISHICDNLLNKDLNSSSDEKIEAEVKVKEAYFKKSNTDNTDDKISNFNKISCDIFEFASILEKEFINNGMKIGKDFSKMDCYKFALEIMKYSQKSEQCNPPYIVQNTFDSSNFPDPNNKHIDCIIERKPD